MLKVVCYSIYHSPRALFRAAWIEGLDVNEEHVIRHAASLAGLDPDRLITQALQDDTRGMLEASLAAFERDRCPGVPTWVLNGKRFWGKARSTVSRTQEVCGKYLWGVRARRDCGGCGTYK